MPKLWRKKALLAKIEGTYGVDSTPIGSADAMLATNVRLTPVQGQDVQRALDKPFLGHQGSIPVGEHVALEFEIEMAGSGTVDTAVAYAPLILACGFDETVNAAVSVEYNPVSAAFSSVTIYINIDGVQHKMLGCRGGLSVTVAPSALNKFRFTFLGLLVAAADVSLPTIDTSAFKDPLPGSDTNTPTFTLHGYSAEVEAFELSMNNAVAGRFLIGGEEIVIGDRPATGQLTYRATALATFNPFSRAVPPKTQGTLAIVHGTTGGNIVQIDCGQTELGRTTYNESEGDAMWITPFDILPSDAGNDEIKITTK